MYTPHKSILLSIEIKNKNYGNESKFHENSNPKRSSIVESSFEVVQSAISWCRTCTIFNHPLSGISRRTHTRGGWMYVHTRYPGVTPNCTDIDYRSIIRFASYPQTAARGREITGRVVEWPNELWSKAAIEDVPHDSYNISRVSVETQGQSHEEDLWITAIRERSLHCLTSDVSLAGKPMRKYVRCQGALWDELLNTRRENRRSRWILLYALFGMFDNLNWEAFWKSLLRIYQRTDNFGFV